jgi:NADH-quinone oxidoreductase subunit G
MRVLPLENEAINECWLSDRDRYSYEALNSQERLTKPMIKQGGVWQEADWQTALEYVANGLKQVVAEHGKDSVAAVASANSTVEELFTLRKLMAGLGVEAVQAFARNADFSVKTQGAKWLGQSLEELSQNEAVLIVGSTVRKEQPLLAQRLRQAVKKGMALSLVNVHGDDLLTKLAGEVIVRPDQLVEGLLQVVKAVVELKSVATPAGIDLANVVVSDAARAIANSFEGKAKAAVLLGNIAQASARYAEIYAAAAALAALTGAKLGVPAVAANSVGAELIGADVGGDVFAAGKKAYVFVGVEPEYDAHNGAQALAAAKQAEMVVVMSAFQSCAMDYADVLLPISPFTETSGTFVNMEGKAQSFNGVVRPLGETRPAWKVFRVLGNVLGFNGFDYNSSEEIRDEALAGDIANRLNNALATSVAVAAKSAQGLVRLGEVPVYQGDSIVRRAPSLQATADAALAATVRLNAATIGKLGLVDGGKAVVKQGQGSAELTVKLDAGLQDDVVRVATSHPLTRDLGEMVGAVEVLKG